MGDTKAQVAEIDQIREQLAGTIDQLIDRVKPSSIAGRAVAGVKAKFIGPDGSPRFETIVPVVAAVAGSIAAVVVIRRLTR